MVTTTECLGTQKKKKTLKSHKIPSCVSLCTKCYNLQLLDNTEVTLSVSLKCVFISYNMINKYNKQNSCDVMIREQ